MSRTDLPSLPSHDNDRSFSVCPGGHRKEGAETLGSEGGRKTNRTIYEILSSFAGPREEIEKFFYVRISLSLSLACDWFGADALPHWNSSRWSNSLSRYLHADVPIPISNPRVPYVIQPARTVLSCGNFTIWEGKIFSCSSLLRFSIL